MPSGYELGMFVQQIAEKDDPRAIILDFLQRSILVHPKSEDDVESADFTAESLAFLLTSVELEHTELTLTDALSEFVKDGQHYWICAHPDQKDSVPNTNGDMLWTKIVEPAYLLLVTRSFNQDPEWRVIGMSLTNPQDT